MCEHDGNKNVFSKCMQKERKSIIEDYIDEFESLQYAKEYFIDVILEQNQNGDLGPKVIHGTLPNGCPFRCVIPNGRGAATPSQANHSYFVGFFGRLRTGIDPDFKHTLWETDVQLVEAVQRADYCICYLSAQREPDSPDWFNIVLLHDAAGVDLWNQGDLHQFCVRSISPQCYQRVRIHMGVQHQRTYSPKRTTFLYYDTDEQGQRTVSGRLRREWNDTITV